MPTPPKKQRPQRRRPASRPNTPQRRPQKKPDAAPARQPESAPEKLHKVLARAGVGSRRVMEAAIAAGRVTINGRVATLGERVSAADRIALDGNPVKVAQGPGDLPRVLIYYKPTGEVSTLRDPEGRPTVFDRLPVVRNARWIQVGRLDFNTSGLLVFTTSGELANRLMHPSGRIEREYAVRVLGQLSHAQLETLRRGVMLEDGLAKFELIDPQGGQGANRWYRVVIMEGRNREVRRMFEAAGLAVSRLIRTRFGPFTLPDTLHRGKSMELSPQMVRTVLRELDSERKV